jgi:hypothetical protein
VEISELFTYKYFYDFLVNKSKEMQIEINKLIEIKNQTKKRLKLFHGETWVSMPLKFHISKGNSGTRELNILQPLAAMQIYYFISIFQDELLIYLKKHSVFSLRYQKKCSSLYYKAKNKNIVNYFSDFSNEMQKRSVEQTGRYFDLIPYKTLSNFNNSNEWFDLNTKYKYFARIDYKLCFDSIYTHVYKWIISNDVNDSKRFKNGNLFITVDRLLQNINAFSSNGLVVGPEFSRMIAELLLQQIDTNVYLSLLNDEYTPDINYSARRYVDDIYIFAEHEDLLDHIIELFRNVAGHFLLFLNENKIKKEKLPFIMTKWLYELNKYSTNMSNMLFRTDDELSKQAQNGENYSFKAKVFYDVKPSLKRNFNDLVAKYGDEKSKLTSYVLGTILKKIIAVKTNRKNKIFRYNIKDRTLYEIMDYFFYVYSHSANFENTQRFISIISYVNDDVNLITSHHVVFQKLLNKYAYIFKQNNQNDIINLVLLCTAASLEIPFIYETFLKDSIFKSDNPVNHAVFLIYSKYDEKFFKEMQDCINRVLLNKIETMQNKGYILTYKEFWWLLVFNKSPYIDSAIQMEFDALIDSIPIKPSVDVIPNNISMAIFCDFLKYSTKQFFSWDVESRNLLKEITYRTHERTIFRNYRYGQTPYSSIE